jgi:hypothetical protein
MFSTAHPGTIDQNVDTLINRIRDGRDGEALEKRNGSTRLAAAHADQNGQLHGASPPQWAGRRDAGQICQRLTQLGAHVNDSSRVPASVVNTDAE